MENNSSGLYIVNEVDRPCEELLAEKREDNKFFYVHPDLRDKKIYWGITPSNPTPVEDFGVDISIDDGRVIGLLNRPSVVKYEDGSTRHWQGPPAFVFKLPAQKVYDT